MLLYFILQLLSGMAGTHCRASCLVWSEVRSEAYQQLRDKLVTSVHANDFFSGITSAITPAILIGHISVRNAVKGSYITKISLDICRAIQDKDLSNAHFRIVIKRIHERTTLIVMYATIMRPIQMRL
jgi:ABC-type transporter Mla maintaining outer membrane lipid asymmetry permease subunit MlaE